MYYNEIKEIYMIKALLQKLEEALNPIPLYEMSKAFSYKDKRIDVCAWVENPMGVDNQYFKYYNCSTIPWLPRLLE